MTVITAEVGVGNVSGQAFYAAIDTIIYGRQYVQGQEVDTSSWNRRQILQYLSLGLIVGPPVSSDGTPAYLTPCIVVNADERSQTALVRLPNGQLLRDVKVTGTTPRPNASATLVTTTNDRWVIGSGIPSDLVVDSLRTGSLNVVGDTTLAGDTAISKGAEPGWVAVSADELGTIQWQPPANIDTGGGALASQGGVIISEGVAPPSDNLDPGAIWYDPAKDNVGPSFWMFQNLSQKTSGATTNGVFGTLPQWGGYTISVPGPGIVICDWVAAMGLNGGGSGNMRAALYPSPDTDNLGGFAGQGFGAGAYASVSGKSFSKVGAATDIDWDWRGWASDGKAIQMSVGTVKFAFYPNSTGTFANY